MQTDMATGKRRRLLQPGSDPLSSLPNELLGTIAALLAGRDRCLPVKTAFPMYSCLLNACVGIPLLCRVALGGVNASLRESSPTWLSELTVELPARPEVAAFLASWLHARQGECSAAFVHAPLPSAVQLLRHSHLLVYPLQPLCAFL